MASYSDELKAETLAILDANNGNVRKTARQSGIPQSTIRDWRDGRGVTDSVTEIRAHKKGELSDLIRDELEAIFGAMNTKREAANYRELATAAGILIDKMQLLDGDPTSIEQHTWRDIVEQARASNGHR
jgi:transposase-like protein